MATTSASAPVLDPNDPHDQWLLGLDTSHIKPLEDDWEKHPYWAELGELENEESSLAAVAKEMAIEDSPEEKAEDCKVPSFHNHNYTCNGAFSAESPAVTALDAVSGFSDGQVECARRALEADSKHFKSFLRAATAASRLREWTLVQRLCSAGLAVQPDDEDLVQLHERAVDEEEKARKRELELQAAQRERERPFRRVARCITARAYAMTRPQFGFQKNKGAFLPWLEGAAADSEAVPPLGALHFPVMLFYPEASPYHDTIEDVCEADTIGDHLDAAFGEGTPPIGWDEEGSYTRLRVRLFYCSFCGTVLREDQIAETLQERFPSGYVETGCQKYGPRASAMVPVEEQWTFAELLARPDHVMPGIPVLFVAAHGTDFHDRFLKTFDPRGQ